MVGDDWQLISQLVIALPSCFGHRIIIRNSTNHNQIHFLGGDVLISLMSSFFDDLDQGRATV